MASLTSPDWRGFLSRFPVPAGSIPAAPVAPTQGRSLWYSRQQTAPLPAVPHPAPAPAVPPASRPGAAWPPAPSAAYPSWWPAAWPPQPTPPPHPSRLPAGATSKACRSEASITGTPRGTSRLEAGATSGAGRDASAPVWGAGAPGWGVGAPPPAPQPQARTTPGGPPPPTRPAPAQSQPQPVPPRGPRPISPRLRLALEWVVAALPSEQREEVFSDVLETLRFRAALEERCSLEPTQPIGRERFGLAGETLVPEGTVRVRVLLEEEVREIVRTLERRLSRTRRNHFLAMHSARLGQLWRELETRFEIEVLEEVKSALARCWT